MSKNENKKTNKISNRLVAICSVAIGVIYSSGYLVTETHAKEAESMNQQISAVQSQQSTRVQTSVSTQPSDQSTASATPSPSPKSKYRDGTYHGQGANRIGSIEVAVTIKGGKIHAVEITNCTTSYPQSYVDGLPNQVVDRQSSNVDVVSGATRSTEDFQTAVEEALQQASNA